MTTQVSVLLPVYNRAEYVGETIASVLAQTYRDFEIVLVDDGSTDQTAQIIHSIVDPRVRYLYQANRGVAAALNTAWRAATGEYLAMIGSDDVWFPHLLTELVSVLDADSTLDLVYARAQGMDASGTPRSQILGAPPKFPSDWLVSLLYGDCICGIAAVFRRRCIECIAGFDETLVANEDWDVWLRMSEHCHMLYRNVILAQYRIHPRNLTGGQSQSYAQLTLDRIRVLDNFYTRNEVPVNALKIKPIAYRNVYMDIAVRNFAIGQWHNALQYFNKMIRISPNPFMAILRATYVVVYYRLLSKTHCGVALTNRLVMWFRQLSK